MASADRLTYVLGSCDSEYRCRLSAEESKETLDYLIHMVKGWLTHLTPDTITDYLRREYQFEGADLHDAITCIIKVGQRVTLQTRMLPIITLETEKRGDDIHGQLQVKELFFTRKLFLTRDGGWAVFTLELRRSIPADLGKERVSGEDVVSTPTYASLKSLSRKQVDELLEKSGFSCSVVVGAVYHALERYNKGLVERMVKMARLEGEVLAIHNRIR